MAYNPNIPQSTDALSQSQLDLLANFQALQTLIDVNHVDFASGDQGKHKWVTFPVQAGAPGFGAGEDGLFNLPYNNNTSTVNELFVHKQTAAGTSNIPSTCSILSQSTPGNNSGGFTFLPSGILLKWVTTGATTGLTTVTLTGAAPTFTAIFSVILTPVGATTGDENFAVRLVDILSATQFRAYVSSRTGTGAGTGAFKALVIGY